MPSAHCVLYVLAAVFLVVSWAGKCPVQVAVTCLVLDGLWSCWPWR